MQNEPLSPALANFIHTAARLQREGNLAQAESLYQMVLQAKPQQPEVLHLYGLLLFQSGRAQQAISFLERAAASPGAQPAMVIDLAKVYVATGSIAAAEKKLADALGGNPGNYDLQLAMCRVASQSAKLDSAISLYRKLLENFPDQAQPQLELGELFIRQGNFFEAAPVLALACAYSPKDAKTLCLLGAALTALGRHEEAITKFEAAIAINNKLVDAYVNLGSTLLCNPKRLGEAQTALEAAVRIAPNDSDIHSNLGLVHTLRGQPKLAVSAFKKAISLNPTMASAHSNLLFLMQHMPEVSDTTLMEAYAEFARIFELPHVAHWPRFEAPNIRPEKLRVGYVSGDFRNHAVYHFISPILEHHDRSRFEVYCFHNFPTQDDFTHQLKAHADHWIDCYGMSDQLLAERIRSFGLHILVDLSGHTSGNRLPMFARKPSPLQMTWIGYGGTTGLSAMDYRLTDQHLDPVGATEHLHTETLLRLDSFVAPFRPASDSPAVSELPSLSAKKFTFGCLNSAKKITPEVVSAWAQILTKVADSRLLLAADDELVVANIKRLFKGHGIDGDRIDFSPWLPMAEFLALHQKIDLGLDPFPYNGGTTSLHSLWMGVPFVSLVGSRTISRVGTAILSQANLDRFIAKNDAEYVVRAVELAGDREHLSRVRNSLRGSILANRGFDPVAITRALEATYESAWDSRVKGNG